MGYEALNKALALDISSHETETPLSWIDILALAATRKGGSVSWLQDVKTAAQELSKDESPEELVETNTGIIVIISRPIRLL